MKRDCAVSRGVQRRARTDEQIAESQGLVGGRSKQVLGEEKEGCLEQDPSLLLPSNTGATRGSCGGLVLVWRLGCSCLQRVGIAAGSPLSPASG